MKLVIIFLTVSLKCLVFGVSQEEWYKGEIETQVLPSYIEAYNNLQSGILNELLSVNVATLDDTNVGQLVNRLYCSVQKIYNSLQQSIRASEKLQVDVNTRLATNVAQAGVYEQNIIDKETEIVQTDEALNVAFSQLASAEQAVIEKQHAVADAERTYREAEAAVERARLCGRRKRRWLGGKIAGFYKNVLIKPVCSVVNSGGIDGAKDRRSGAYNQLASARDQEQHYRQVVAEKQARKIDLQGQLNSLRFSLSNVQSSLKILQNELLITTNINQQLKQVTTQLSNVFTGSSVLQNTVTNLIDFELLINPLNAIYNSIYQITAFGTIEHINQNQIQQTKTNLAQIILILPNLPFNLNTNLTC